MGPLIEEADPDDHCLTDPGNGEKPTLKPCSKVAQNRLHIYWDFKLVSHIFFKDMHLEIESEKFIFDLIVFWKD